jgi:hypothetical protein
VYDAHKLAGGYGEIFFFRDRAKPLLSERITLGRELCVRIANTRTAFFQKAVISSANDFRFPPMVFPTIVKEVYAAFDCPINKFFRGLQIFRIA